jgi:hypothetical protein
VGESGVKYLLVFGMARSGTSWIGKIFDSHPLILYKHEPDRFLPEIPLAPPLRDAERFAPAVRRFFDRLEKLNQPHVAGTLPVFPKQYRGTAAQQLHRASVLGTVAASSVLKVKLPVYQFAGINKPEIRVVWKSIDSLGRLGLILEVMQDCRAIWITRHPCGSISSALRGQERNKFSSSIFPSEDFGMMQMFLDSAVKNRGLTLDHLHQFHPIERMAWIWVLANEKVEHETRKVGRCKAVRYEDVCSEPTGKMKELFKFGGLTWTEQNTNFIQASTLRVRSGSFDQLTQNSRRYYGIFRDPLRASQKWMAEMKEEDIERVYRVLRHSDLMYLYPESETGTMCVS